MTDGIEAWAAGMRDRDDMTKRTEPEQPTGTACCPVCGKDTPHGHGQEELLSVIRVGQAAIEVLREWLHARSRFTSLEDERKQMPVLEERARKIVDGVYVVQQAPFGWFDVETNHFEKGAGEPLRPTYIPLYAAPQAADPAKSAAPVEETAIKK